MSKFITNLKQKQSRQKKDVAEEFRKIMNGPGFMSEKLDTK